MEANFVTSHHTKANTFAIHAKATRKAKIAKELTFLASRLGKFCHLDTLRYRAGTPLYPSISLRAGYRFSEHVWNIEY